MIDRKIDDLLSVKSRRLCHPLVVGSSIGKQNLSHAMFPGRAMASNYTIFFFNLMGSVMFDSCYHAVMVLNRMEQDE